MADIITILILGVIIFLIIRYLYRAKKRGEACIGCPYAKQCGGDCSGLHKSDRKESDNQNSKKEEKNI